ncbi:hypothetical protein [Gemmata sp.]|uniref:hypothetical protein n=1 Tax=Gemmata sp. TaxID=1914242 RepID=UPI003F71C58E
MNPGTILTRGRHMRLGRRLEWAERAERAVRDRPRADQFSVVQAVPMGRSGGLPLGLHADGPRGSTAGVLVYDPAAGRPAVPEGRMAP